MAIYKTQQLGIPTLFQFDYTHFRLPRPLLISVLIPKNFPGKGLAMTGGLSSLRQRNDLSVNLPHRALCHCEPQL